MSIENSEINESSSEEEYAVERVRLLKDEFERVKSGEVTYGGTIRQDLVKTLETFSHKISYEEGKDIEQMIDLIPVFELKNLITQVKEHMDDEDISGAKSLHAEAEQLLADYQGELVTGIGIDNAAADLERLGDELYS